MKPAVLQWKVFEPLNLLGRQRFADLDIRVRVKGGGRCVSGGEGWHHRRRATPGLLWPPLRARSVLWMVLCHLAPPMAWSGTPALRGAWGKVSQRGGRAGGDPAVTTRWLGRGMLRWRARPGACALERGIRGTAGARR